MAALATAIFVAASPGIFAAEATWNPRVDEGSFSAGSNWLGGGVPANTDTALFVNAGKVTVQFEDSIELAELCYDGSETSGNPAVLTLELQGRELVVNGNFKMAAESSKGVRTVVVRQGRFAMKRLQLGNSFSGGGVELSVMRVEDEGVLAPGSVVRIGDDRPAALLLDAGAKFETSHFVFIGRAESGEGTVTIRGIGAKWITSGASSENENDVVTVGFLGSGSMSVLEGGRFEGQILQLGKEIASQHVQGTHTGSGVLLVSGSGSTVTAREFYLGGGRDEYNSNPEIKAPSGGGNGHAVFSNGAAGTFGRLRVFRTKATVDGQAVLTQGKLDIGQAVITVKDAAIFEKGAQLGLGIASPAQKVALEVDGTLGIAGAQLQLTLDKDFRAAIGQSIPLISYSTLNGAFEGLPDKGILTVEGRSFRIDYDLGGRGNTIGLTVVSKPQAKLSSPNKSLLTANTAVSEK